MTTFDEVSKYDNGRCKQWSPLALSLLTMSTKRALTDSCARIMIDPASLRAFVIEASSSPDSYAYRRLEAARPDKVRPDVMQSFMSQLHKSRTVGPYNARVLSIHDLGGPGAKVMSMFRQIGIERRCRIGHLIRKVRGAEWMLLYCDVVDVAASQDPEGLLDNHWVYGPHMHLIHSLENSYLSLDQLVANFLGMRKLKSTIHIRFHDPEWGQQFQEKYHPAVRR